MNIITCTTIQAKQTPANRKYWKTYVVFGCMLGLSALLNTMASVESMYNSTNSQELEFKKNQLTTQIQELEQQRSQAVNLHQIQEQALAQGFVAVEKLQYVNAPSSQKVAER